MACELCAAVEWNLCQLSASEQGTMDSCQQQHTPGEAKVWPSITSPQMETHPFLICPPLHSVCQTDTRISTHVHAHRHWGALRVKKQKGKYLQGKVWSGPRMSWLILSSYTQFNCDFKASWTASECPQLTCLWSDMVRYSLDRISLDSIWSWYLPAPYTQRLTYSCILYSVS